MAEHETIADIIAEMKRESAQMFPALPIAVLQLANRLEAAHKRELAASGNAAKLREAIGYLCERMADMDAAFDPSEVECLRDALAAPPRNCDEGTEQEQQDRFREFCRHYESKGECGIGRYEAACPAFQGGRNPDCSLWWAHMPYKAQEGGAKGRK